MSSESGTGSRFDAIIIGGGFYGCCIALVLRNFCDRILLVDKEKDLLLRASAINQARVHTGYHYPRSLVTAIRSFVNFPRFLLDFKGCIYDEFVKLYAIARRGSKVNAFQFHETFKRIGAPIEIAPVRFKKLFNADTIEEVFLVREVAFDAARLREILRERLDRAGIELSLETEVRKVAGNEDGSVDVLLSNGLRFTGGKVFNCTYSRINTLLKNSDLPLLPLKHELTEMPLVEMPDELKNVGITVMDGPFFSLMPYPSLNLHSFPHVRYTPHYEWRDMEQCIDGHQLLRTADLKTHFPFMVKDAARYMPLIGEVRYKESLFEVKTVLVQNEIDDGRPILFRRDHGLKNFSTVMGGKIDNIYDVLEMIGEIKEYSGYSPKGLLRYLKNDGLVKNQQPGNHVS